MRKICVVPLLFFAMAIALMLVSAAFPTCANFFLLRPTDCVVSLPKAPKNSRQIQVSHATSLNRYPVEYASAKKYIEDLGRKGEKRLLSFGSSTGLEAISLVQLYFNGDQDIKVFGVDLDEVTLIEARRNVAAQSPNIEVGKITFFNGNEIAIGHYGPYDAIFANSVLCYHGGGYNASEIIKHFSFQDYEKVLKELDHSLVVGGILAIVNSNYDFSDSTIAKRYGVVASCPENFVRRIDPMTKKFRKLRKNMDCIWVKER